MRYSSLIGVNRRSSAAQVLLLLLPSALAQTLTTQTTPTPASLRGISAINPNTAWASGASGSCLRTTDGRTWQTCDPPNTADLDFRAVCALNDKTAWLLSIGTGPASRIYKTTDGGAHWTLQFTNPDSKGFLDGLAFWDADHGIALGDPVDGRFAIFTTADSGAHWQRQTTPPAMPGEGAFAASNTSLALLGSSEVWFGTGGPAGARVFHSRDGGRSWTVAPTLIRNDSASAGIFSLAFSDERHGIAVGGDYSKPTDDAKNIAITSDGGGTWTVPAGNRPAGFRCAAAWLPSQKVWIVTGTSGSDVSPAAANSWKTFDSGNYNAIAVLPDGTGWTVGPRGHIARLTWK